MKDLVTIEDFRKLDFHIGRITDTSRVDGSDKLLLLRVSLGKASDSDESETRDYLRQVVAGIGKAYDPQGLIGKQAVILVNIEPRMILGVESQGMLIAVDGDDGPVLIIPEKEVRDGSVLC